MQTETRRHQQRPCAPRRAKQSPVLAFVCVWATCALGWSCGRVDELGGAEETLESPKTTATLPAASTASPPPVETAQTSDGSAPPVTVTVVVTVTVTPEPQPTPRVKVWAASASSRLLVGFDTAGNHVRTIDVSQQLASGGISALAAPDARTLLAFFDPGTSGETIARVDLEAVTVFPGFLISAAFNNQVMGNLDFGAGQLFGARAANAERVIVDLPNNVGLRAGAPWPLANTAACPVTNVSFVKVLLHGASRFLLMASAGANARINIYGNLEAVPTCAAGNSYNFASAAPAATGFTVVGATQIGTKVYVRYHHATTPRIYAYDFNGTTLSNGGSAVFADPAVLSTNVASRELVALDAQTLLLADWSNGALHRISTEGAYKGVFARNGYTGAVSALVVMPE